MITLYAWPTPNAFKISIMLEECGVPYRVTPVNISAGDQFTKAFLELNPNNKMPVIIDDEGPDGKPITIFESGAILMYLGEKFGKFFPQDKRARFMVTQWLMWQMAGFGPMLGQAHHFRIYAPEKIQYGIDRYTNEAKRLYGVLENRLTESKFVGGDDYTIADMAIYPWCQGYDLQGIDLDAHPHIKAWRERIAARPAVQKGMQLLAEFKRDPKTKPLTDDERKVLFGTGGR